MKSAVLWALREPCDPVHIYWLALHGSMGNINNHIQLCVVCVLRVCVCVCVCVCVHVCVCSIRVCVSNGPL